MGSNTLLTIDMVTKEALRLAHEKAAFIGTINRQFDSSFGDGNGKIGDTLRIRLPSQYTRRQGSRVMDVQDAVEQSISVTSATQDGVDMRFNSREMALDLQNFSKIHLEPAIAVMISGIESDVLQGCTKQVWNVAGTAGTPPADLAAVGSARARLNQGLAPKDGNRAIQMDSVTMGGLVNGLKGLFQDSQQIKEQYREGLVGRTAMADFYENERTWTMSNGADVTGTTDASNALVTDGGNSITADASAAIAVTVGQVFTVAGVYACHPETKAAYSYLQDFVVTAGDGVASTRVLTVSPSIYLTGARKNVSKSDGTNLAVTDFTNKTMTFRGAASTSYQQSLMYHKDAFTFVTAALPIMSDSVRCSVETFDGLSLRVWQQSDIRNDELLTRIDMLYGYKAIRPQWASRITS
jgi:hypothetical protein